MSESEWIEHARICLQNTLDFIGVDGVVDPKFQSNTDRLCTTMRMLLNKVPAKKKFVPSGSRCE